MFNPDKASFLLVAMVMAWILLLVTEGLTWCLWRQTCGPAMDHLSELLNTILSSALAFAAGRVSHKERDNE